MKEKDKQQRSPRTNYSRTFKREVALEYHLGKLGRQELAEKYKISDPTNISHWSNIFAEEINNFQLSAMKRIPKGEIKSEREIALEERIRQLEKRLDKQEKALNYSKMEATAYKTMIDIAEEQLHVQIIKKPGTKQ